MDTPEMEYLTLYIDQNNDNWSERIVVISEMLETPTIAIGILQSALLKDMPGMVIGGVELKYFIQRLAEVDSKAKLGSKRLSTICDTITFIAEKMGLHIMYSQWCVG